MPFLVIVQTKSTALKKQLLNYIRAIFICSIILPSLACAATKIHFWHSMTGKNGEALQAMVEDFNRAQSEYQIITSYKGEYSASLTSLVAAYRAGRQPDIAQVFEVGTATMIHPPGVIVPVAKILKQYQPAFPVQDLNPAIARYYSDQKNGLLAWPLNVSTPLLYYNVDAYTKSGLEPKKAPQTWQQVHDNSLQLLKHGYHCGFTTEWPAWIMLEEFADRHRLPFATQDNGFKGLDTKLTFNTFPFVRHIKTFTKWQQQNVFCYGGRKDDPQTLFLSGTASMMTGSSGGAADIMHMAPFKVGVAQLPYWEKGYSTTIGGAALWVLSGHSKQVDRGIAKFIVFMAEPTRQQAWQAKTGYLPVMRSVVINNLRSGFYKQHPSQWLALQQLYSANKQNEMIGRRLGNYMQIRVIEDQALESAWSGVQTAKQALDKAVTRGNRLLKRFKQEV